MERADKIKNKFENKKKITNLNKEHAGTVSYLCLDQTGRSTVTAPESLDQTKLDWT